MKAKVCVLSVMFGMLALGPGVCFGVEVLNEDFEGTWPPSGWTVVDYGGTCVWQTTGVTGRTNYAGGNGIAADADSDWCGSASTMDTGLQTPVLDLSGATTSATLDFIGAYNDITSPGADHFDVRISDDGGATWTTLSTWDEDHNAYGPGEAVQIDISAYATANVIIEFYYYAPGWDWWAMVDNVVVNAEPVPVELMEFLVE